MAGWKLDMTVVDYPNRKVVLGLGNLLLGDEGFGIHAIQYLQARVGKQFPVEWVDGGVLGLNLLPLVEACSHLLVLDAVDAGKPGGSLVELVQDEIPQYNGMKLSEHQVGFQEVLGVAKFRGGYPTQLHLIGVQSVDLSTGIELSPAVAAALPAVYQRVKVLLQSWFQ
jgi:hydrogenase maturation protease